MKDLWDYSGCDTMCFGDQKQESYKKAAEFLGDSVEDWGGGTAWAKQFFTNYKNIDGSKSNHLDVYADLREYTSDCDNILMRQCLELNEDWRIILDNVKQSFRKKFCLIIYTPLVRKTRVGHLHTPVKSDGTKMQNEVISEMYFCKEDILECFPEEEFKVEQEFIKTEQGYHNEWILYIEKI